MSFDFVFIKTLPVSHHVDQVLRKLPKEVFLRTVRFTVFTIACGKDRMK
jgi:hypothetical protein